MIRVLRGEPTPEELAALVAVVSTRGASAEPSALPEASQWADRSLFLRRPLPHGPGGWRASARRR